MTGCAAWADVTVTGIHSFAVATNGVYPETTLVQGLDGYLYGTTSSGGTNGPHGTIFKVSTNGALTTIHCFTGGSDGERPSGLLQCSDGYLYGTSSTLMGGTSRVGGTVFKISANGALTTLYSFSAGVFPSSGLIQGGDGDLYGVTGGGPYPTNFGTIYKISTNGVLTTLYAFTGGSDGIYPSGKLTLGGDGAFYGTTGNGGTSGFGTVFRLSSDGLFKSLYSFSGAGDSGEPIGLVQGSDGNLYGTTMLNGGTVFQITSNGTFATMYSFTNDTDGRFPSALTQGNDGYLYGTTSEGGGAQNRGTVFRINTAGVLTTLYAFPYSLFGTDPGSLVQGSDGNFYGPTIYGGAQQLGSLFRISTSGSFATLFSFTRAVDGAVPQGALVLDKDGMFYGTTSQGGSKNFGTVFKLGSAGSFNVLYTFTGAGGANPAAGLAVGSDGNLYGTAAFGGAANYGSVFRISTNGVFSRLYSFTGGTDGESPCTALVQASDGRLYGTTPNNYDNIFKIGTGGGLTVLTNFTDYNQNANPQALIQGSDGNFYGTLADCFPITQPPFYEQVFYNNGTVFQMSPAGVLTTLHAFDGMTDGGNPLAGLVQGRDGNLYGTTSGGTNNAGTVFQIGTNGNFTTLYFFSGGADGAVPMAGLVQGLDGSFYGTTSSGGNQTNQYGQTFGTVFQISTNGAFANLYSFTGGTDGGVPQASLIQGNDGSLYGTTAYGGIGGLGTVFHLSMGPTRAPQLSSSFSGSILMVSWSTNATGFVLQSATKLNNGGDWQNSSLVPNQTNGQNAVSINTSSAANFFRLRQQ